MNDHAYFLSLNDPPKLKRFPNDGRYYNIETNRLINNPGNRKVHHELPFTADSVESLNYFCRFNDFELPQARQGETEKQIDEQIDLQTFSLTRLSVPGKITNVVDGDTVDVDVEIKLGQLTEPGYFVSRVDGTTKSRRKVLLKTDNPETKIWISLRCRLFGIDTAEKDTDKGKEAKAKAIEFYDISNNLVTVCLTGTDSKGRTLAIFYNPDDPISINEKLLTYISEDLGKITTFYQGETKTNFDDTVEPNPFAGRPLLKDFNNPSPDNNEDDTDGCCVIC